MTVSENSPVIAPVIAIDGPTASGKGTLARKLAESMNFAYLDTGKIYRAVGLKVLQAGDNAEDPDAVLPHVFLLHINDLSNPRLSQDDVAQMASKVAKHPPVREALKQFQIDFANHPPQGFQGAVLDGRDIGTVICPNAPLKLYIDADQTIRAERRFQEFKTAGMDISFEDVLTDLKSRDDRDMNRPVAPLKPAPDAIILDTSKMDAETVLQTAMESAKSIF